MATCPPELSGWAGRIIDYIGDTGISTGSTVSWFQYNLYRLNLRLETSFYLTESGCIADQLNPIQSGIYEKIYYCDYLSRKATNFIGAGAFDWTQIDGDKQGMVRRVSSNETAKTARTQAQDCKTELDELIDLYNNNGYYSMPSQITFNERNHTSQDSLMGYGCDWYGVTMCWSGYCYP